MHKLIKFSFNATVNGLKLYQFCLILVALLTMIDFILQLVRVKLPEQIQVVFDTIYRFQSLIYKPDMSVIPVDFTLAVFAIEMLILAGLLVYVIYFVLEFEQIYDRVHADGCRRYEQKFNQNLERTAKIVENKTKYFVIYYDINIEKVASDFIYSEQNEINLNTKISEYRLMLRTYIMQAFKGTSQQTADGYLLFFDNIEMADKIFDKMREFEIKSKEILKQNKLKFTLKTAACIASPKSRQSEFVPKLNKLLNIAIPKKIMVLGDFKSKYQNLKSKSYIINALGEYSLGSEILDVYTLEANHQ